MNQEREEPSTLILETLAVAEHKPEGLVGGGERSMVEVEEDAETGILCGTKDKTGIPMVVCGRTGQAGREGVPRNDMTSEVAEEAEAESIDTDVGEATYFFGKVHKAERSTRRAMWPCKGRATSTGIIGNEVRRMTVPNQGSLRAESGTRIWWIVWSLRFEIIRRRW